MSGNVAGEEKADAETSVLTLRQKQIAALRASADGCRAASVNHAQHGLPFLARDSMKQSQAFDAEADAMECKAAIDPVEPASLAEAMRRNYGQKVEQCEAQASWWRRLLGLK